MTTTTAHGLPVPEETDPLGESDERIVELAEHLDELLFKPRLYTGDAAMEVLGLQPWEPDTPNQLGPAAGPTHGIAVVVAGAHVELYLDFDIFLAGAIGRQLDPGTTGDIPNLVYALKINNPAFRPLVQTAGSSTRSATRVAAYTLDQAGVVYCSAVSGTELVNPSNTKLSTSFTYLRAGE